MENNAQNITVIENSNEEAVKVIEESIRRKMDRKRESLSEFLGIINEICRDKDLQYFAMGKLLTYGLTGEDPFPETYTYHIGMMRDDFEEFMKQAAALSEEKKITVIDMFTSEDTLRGVFASLVMEKNYSRDNDVDFLTLKIIVHPLDHLPDDEQERTDFRQSVETASQDFRSSTRLYKDMKAGESKVRSKGIFARKLYHWKMRRMLNSFPSRKRKYLSFITKYNQASTEYIGYIQFMLHPEWLYADAFPCSRIPFLDTEMMVPHNTDFFRGATMEDEEKKAFEGRLEVLKAINRICESEGLSYFAMRKLAIAAVKEDAFPDGPRRVRWDIGMMRADYERFLTLVREGSCPEIGLKEGVNEHPFIYDSLKSVYLKKHRKMFPAEREFLVYLYPFDSLPDHYDNKLDYIRELQAKAILQNELIEYEKGTVYPGPETDLNTREYFEAFRKDRTRYNESDPDSAQIFTVHKNVLMICPRNEMLPVSKGEFFGEEICLPNNRYFWHDNLDPNYHDYFTGKRFEIIKIISRITEEHGLQYFAIADLLRGAVIYHDAVPAVPQKNWDLAMLRDDYEKFVGIMREHASDYGVELHESLDGEGKYPVPEKYITMKGKKFSGERVRFIPFDKVPEDFLLFRGFLDDMDEQNRRYRAMLKYYHYRDLQYISDEENAQRDLPTTEEIVGVSLAEEAVRIDRKAQSFNDDSRTHRYMRMSLGKSKPIMEDDLFPLKKVEFRDGQLSCPRVTTVWQPTIDDELDRQVHAIQKADLLLLQEFDRVCELMGLGYFVCGGTMLGYMRHGGFIPWDDDVDVAMLRADYERFIHEAGPYLKEKYFLQTRDTDPNIPYLFSKLRMDDTEYITEYNAERDFHKGLCLDIFPFDYIPENLNEREAFLAEIKMRADEHHLIARRQYPFPKEEIEPRNEQEREYLKKQKKLLKNYWKKDLSVSQKAYYDTVTRYNDKAEELGLHTVGSFVPSYTWISLSDLLPYQRGKFEDITVSVPKRPDIFLSMQYGDYMSLPPKHMQIAHPLVRWSTWEESSDRKAEEKDPSAEEN